MNKERRKTLDKAHSLILEAQELIAGARDDEQDAFYNLPDSLQSSERGELMEEYIGSLDEMESNIDDILSNLMEIIEG